MNLISREDQVFLNRLSQIINANLEDENFGVNELSIQIGLSRSYIHRKLKSILNKSLSQLIREIRLEKSKEFLESGNFTVSEIAYKVGFGSPSYFIKCFHEYFGYAPGEMKKKLIYDESLSELGNISVKKEYRIRSKTLVIFVALVLLLFSGWFTYSQLKRPGKPKLSIIVLPFKNLSDDLSNQYFADGIREEILNNLMQIKSLRVISNTTAESFGDNLITAHDIAQQVHARYILEGSIRCYNNKIRINAQLIDAKKDNHIWSDYYDREMNNVIGVQNEIAMQVADKLKAFLTENEVKQIKKILTQSPEANDYYLRARFFLNKANSSQRSGFNASGVINAVKYYNMAIVADSGFAEAYAGLANATTQLTAWGIARDTGMVNKVYELCQKALYIDPDCAEAHAVLGLNFWFKHNFERSGKEYRKAIGSDPNFAAARQWYAQHLMITGPIGEARKEVNRALELEPFFWVVKNLDAWIAYFEKDYKRSLEVSRVAHDFNPDFSSNMWLTFLNQVKLNQGNKACEQLKAIVRKYSRTEDYSAEIDSAFGQEGIEGLLNCMIEININKPIKVEGLNGNSFYNAWWYAILGDKEMSLFWLEKTVSNKIAPYHYLNLIINHPDFEFLKDDPRFFKITEKIGISAYFNVS